MLNLPQKVTIREESPRDGLQNENTIVPTDAKIAFINSILETGVSRIQITSFVSPRQVPQLADSFELLMRINQKPDVIYSVLIPNKRGLQHALDIRSAGKKCDEACFVISASENHSKANLNRTINEVLYDLPLLITTAHNAGMHVSVGISAAFGFSGDEDVPKTRVTNIARQLYDMGAEEIVLADTEGLANPVQVCEYFTELKSAIPSIEISAHFHDTWGIGLANVLAALQTGVTTFDSCIGGMGGCPYAPRSPGNIATEDLINMLSKMGIETGISLEKILRCGREAEKLVNRSLSSHMLQASGF